MPIHFVGNPGSVPFDRVFFSAVIGELVEKAGKDRPHRLTLFLSDGVTMDVCKIEEIEDQYLVLRCSRTGVETCDLGLEVVPYGLIYRISLAPQENTDERVGFRWTPVEEKRVTKRRVRG
jgi:hypothetical protein